jgi:alpha-ketoglutarate-dependent taurine dioxygenase
MSTLRFVLYCETSERVFMIPVNCRHYSSYSEILGDLDAILEVFFRESVVVLRGANLTTDEQLELTRALGDISGWTPNSSSDFEQAYQESHSRLPNKETVSSDEVALGWHLEHIEYDDHSPIIAGVWNMLKFKVEPDVGKTWFVDMSKIYNLLPSNDQEFLENSVQTWVEPHDGKEFTTDVVKAHWYTGERAIRMHMTRFNSDSHWLSTFDGRLPTPAEAFRYEELKNVIHNYVWDDISVRAEHRWNQGDLILADLFKNAHAVTGGFSSEDREFVGLWVYPSNPEDAPKYVKLIETRENGVNSVYGI